MRLWRALLLGALPAAGCAEGPQEVVTLSPRTSPVQDSSGTPPGIALTPGTSMGRGLALEADTLGLAFPAVLTFWAPWLPRAEAHLKALGAVRSRFPNLRIYVAAPTDEGERLDDGLAPVRQTPALREALGGVWSLPTTFLIGAEGTVEQRWIGPLDVHGLEAALTALGQEAAPVAKADQPAEPAGD